MSKFIKVTGQTCREEKIIFASSIDEIVRDGNKGSIIYYNDDSRFFTKEPIEQIEAQLLRDEFAKHAMQAIVSSIIEMADRTYYQVESSEQVAKHAYETADAMLKERMK